MRITATNDVPPPFAKLGTRALVVLTLINMFNYIDRYVVPPLFESLRSDPVMGHPSDAQLGGLMTAFLVVGKCQAACRNGSGAQGANGRTIGWGGHSKGARRQRDHSDRVARHV